MYVPVPLPSTDEFRRHVIATHDKLNEEAAYLIRNDADRTDSDEDGAYHLFNRDTFDAMLIPSVTR